MGKSFDAESRTLGAILGSFERRVVVVPRFQRAYSWEKQHVSTFWKDVQRLCEEYEKAPKSASYFFGPIVTQNQTEEIQLLDGQQRLATATILLAVIRDAARTLNQEVIGSHGPELAREIQVTLIEKEDSDPPFSLRLGELDSDFFRKIVQKDPPEDLKPELRSHELIRSARKLLGEEVEKLISGLDPQKAVRKLKLIKDAVAKSMLVVAINVESEDDAYDIFETLNDRGLRLSVPDLLLNLLMRRAASEAERTEVRQQWNYILEQLGRKDVSRFLRHMWLSRYGDLKAHSLFNELKAHLGKENGNNITSIEFVEACAVDCSHYVALTDQTKNIPESAHTYVAGLVRYLGVTSSLPLLLAGLQSLKEIDFAKLVKAMASLAVRFSVISDLNPNTLESAFYEAARAMRAMKEEGKPSGAILTSTLALLGKMDPSDSFVMDKARSVTLDRAPALWIMTRIANHMQSQTKEVSISESNLEHVFPQNATLTHWPNKADLQPYVWTLGNLTILGEDFNRRASNKSYATKITNYYACSELNITQEIVSTYAQWTPVEVAHRTAVMAEMIVKVFPSIAI